MSLNHSEETHRNLVARVPLATGRDLREWFRALEHATAIVHEHDLRRAQRLFE